MLDLIQMLLPNKWWEQFLLYVVISWLLNVMLLRYYPSRCPEVYEAKERIFLERGGSKVVDVERHRDDDYCYRHFWRGHWFHRWPRNFAVLAWLWPFFLPVVLVVALGQAFVMSILKAGRYFEEEEETGTVIVEDR